MICIYQKIICHKNYVKDDLRFLFSFFNAKRRMGGLLEIYLLIYIVYIYASHTGVVENVFKYLYLTNMAKFYPIFRLVDFDYHRNSTTPSCLVDI